VVAPLTCENPFITHFLSDQVLSKECLVSAVCYPVADLLFFVSKLTQSFGRSGGIARRSARTGTQVLFHIWEKSLALGKTIIDLLMMFLLDRYAKIRSTPSNAGF